jgi:hypothetical protein
MEPRNRFQGMNSATLWSLAGRYENPIPTRFLAPIDCLKIQFWAQWKQSVFTYYLQNCLKEDFKKIKDKRGETVQRNRCIMFSKVNVSEEEKKSQNPRPAGVEDGAWIFKLFRSRYGNLFPTRFLAPIDCLKIPAQISPNLYKAFYISTCVTSQGFLSYCWYSIRKD